MADTGFLDLFDPSGLEFTNPGSQLPDFAPTDLPLPGMDALRPNVAVGTSGLFPGAGPETGLGGLAGAAGGAFSGAEAGLGMVFDSQQGDWITLQQAQQRDPQGFLELTQTNPEIAQQVQQMQQGGGTPFGAQTPLPTMAGGPRASSPAPMGALGEQPGQAAPDPNSLFGIPIKNIELGLGLGTAGVGLVGLIQKMVAGDAGARQKVTQTYEQGTPQQRQMIQQMVQGIQQQLGQQAPGQQAAYQQALLGQQGLTRDVLQNLGLGGLLQQQGGMLGALGPVAQGLAQGRLNLSPELEKTVEEAFAPQLGELSKRAIEQARAQGFAGGAELLTQTPAAALAGPGLAQIQGQQAAAKLALAQSLPLLASQLSGSLTAPIAARGALGQGAIGGLAGFGQQAFQNPLALLAAQQGGLGGQTRGQTITPGHPFGLLEAFDPLNKIFGAAGGYLGQYGTLSGMEQSPQTTLAGLRGGLAGTPGLSQYA